MINSMAELGYMGLAIVLLFGAVILLGLRSRRRFVAAASSGLVAADLWPRYGDPAGNRRTLSMELQLTFL